MKIFALPRADQFVHRAFRLATAAALLSLGGLAGLAGLAGCGGTTAATSTGPSAIFVAPAAGEVADLTTVPWPSKLLLDDAGHIRLKSYYPLQATPAQALVSADFANHDGYSVSTGAFFPTSAAVDEASLKGRALLIDLGAASGCPLVPVVGNARPEELLVQVRPAIGQVLLEAHDYAYVLLDGITAGGKPLLASADFAAIRDGKVGLGDARLLRAASMLAPLLGKPGCLPEGARPVIATVFKTQTVTKLLGDARAALYAEAAPAARTAYVYARAPQKGSSGSLDELMGTPMTSRPGGDNAGGIAHDGMAFVVQGAFNAPDFLAATMPTADATSATTTLASTLHVEGQKPTALGHATIPFTLVLPAGLTSYADVPVVVWQHGLGGDRVAVLAVGNTLAKAGLATIGIEIPFHGLRAPGATDTVHNITGKPGSDGFAEQSDPGAPLFKFFDITGDKDRGVPSLSPAVIRASFQQASIDLMSEIRLVTEGDWSDLGKRDPRLATLSFKKGKVVYAGESFGSILGGIVTAMEPKVGASVLSVGGGGLLEPLLTWSVVYGPTFQVLLEANLGVNVVSAPIESDFGYSLFQFLLETGDPIAYAPYVIQHPLAGAAPRHVVMLNAFADESVPNAANEHLAGALGLDFARCTVGGTPVYDYTLPAPTVKAAPLTGNVMVGGQPVTAAIVQFQTAVHGMITNQRGLRTHDTRARPFAKLSKEQPIDNPIEALQAIMAGVATDFYAGKTPTLIDPR